MLKRAAMMNSSWNDPGLAENFSNNVCTEAARSYGFHGSGRTNTEMLGLVGEMISAGQSF